MIISDFNGDFHNVRLEKKSFLSYFLSKPPQASPMKWKVSISHLSIWIPQTLIHPPSERNNLVSAVSCVAPRRIEKLGKSQ